MIGGNISVNSISSWVVVKNTSGISYGGIDTTAKDVMSTVVNRNVSTFLIRIGAQNSSPTKSEVRYRSVYFKTFNYGAPCSPGNKHYPEPKRQQERCGC